MLQNLAKAHLAATVAAILVSATAHAGLSSRSYVQRGLAVQYDGINNVDHGAEHDPNASTWTDLTGNGVNGTVTNAVTWVEKGWTYNGADAIKPVTVGSGLAAKIALNGMFSMQMTFTPSDNATVSLFGQNPYATGSYQFQVDRNASGSNETFPHPLSFYAGSPIWRNSKASMSMATGEWSPITLSVNTNATSYTYVFYNGSNPNSPAASPTGTVTGDSKPGFSSDCTSVIGANNQDSSKPWQTFRGTYNAFRLYTRELTATEIKVNAAVDAIRFNGASAADFPTLGGGWSFDANSDLCVEVKGEVDDVGHGTVRIDGGVAVTSGSAVKMQYATATLSATPKSGYDFDHWEGDTSAITSGSASSPEIAVALNDPAALTAVFVANGGAVTPSPITSRSYVQRGLAVQYDGDKNAGHDAAHSNGAAVWKDLTGNGVDGTVDTAHVQWFNTGWRASDDLGVTPAYTKPVTVGSGLSRITGRGTFTVQAACVDIGTDMNGAAPGYYNEMALLGQDASSRDQFYFELYDAGHLRGRPRFYAGNPVWGLAICDTEAVTNEFATISMAVTSNKTGVAARFWKNQSEGRVVTTDAFTSKNGQIAFDSNCTTIVGGANIASGDDRTFRGDFHAFRLYGRELTEDEVNVNAAVDAIRYNGADPGDFTLGGGWSFDAAGALCVELTVETDTAGAGTVQVDGGVESESVTVEKAQYATATLSATPAKGYVFDGWAGDMDAVEVVSGSAFSRSVTVKVKDPATLKAIFRQSGGNALYGLEFDLDVEDANGNGALDAGTDILGNAVRFGAAEAYEWTAPSTDAAHRPAIASHDVAAPMHPFTTNATGCLDFPQEYAGGSVYGGIVGLPNCAMTGDAMTFFFRFKWDGALKDENSYVTLLMNGCTTNWWTDRVGLAIRIRTDSSQHDVNTGYLTFATPPNGSLSGGNSRMREPVKVSAGEWIDAFVSAYPSPTDPQKMNGDIWICPTPALAAAGTYFENPEIKWLHVGDDSNLPRMTLDAAQSRSMWIGNEPNDVLDGVGGVKASPHGLNAFKGSIAAVKGWNRVLTMNEMWTVMAGRSGGTFNVGVENGNADEFAAADAAEPPPSPSPSDTRKRLEPIWTTLEPSSSTRASTASPFTNVPLALWRSSRNTRPSRTTRMAWRSLTSGKSSRMRHISPRPIIQTPSVSSRVSLFPPISVVIVAMYPYIIPKIGDSGAEDAEFVGAADGRCRVRAAELVHDALQVRLHRLAADSQRGRDLIALAALRDEDEDVHLARRQRRRRGLELFAREVRRPLGGLAYRATEPVLVHVFRQVPRRAAVARANLLALQRHPREHQDARSGRGRLHSLQNAEAVQPRHPHVRQQHVRPQVQSLRDGLLAVGRERRDVEAALAREHGLKPLADHRMVVRYDDRNHFSSR